MPWELRIGWKGPGVETGRSPEGHCNNPGKPMFTWSGESHGENENWSELGEKD